MIQDHDYLQLGAFATGIIGVIALAIARLGSTTNNRLPGNIDEGLKVTPKRSSPSPIILVPSTPNPRSSPSSIILVPSTPNPRRPRSYTRSRSGLRAGSRRRGRSRSRPALRSGSRQRSRQRRLRVQAVEDGGVQFVRHFVNLTAVPDTPVGDVPVTSPAVRSVGSKRASLWNPLRIASVIFAVLMYAVTVSGAKRGLDIPPSKDETSLPAPSTSPLGRTPRALLPSDELSQVPPHIPTVSDEGCEVYRGSQPSLGRGCLVIDRERCNRRGVHGCIRLPNGNECGPFPLSQLVLVHPRERQVVPSIASPRSQLPPSSQNKRMRGGAVDVRRLPMSQLNDTDDQEPKVHHPSIVVGVTDSDCERFSNHA